MKRAMLGLVGLLSIALPLDTAHAWSHAGRYGTASGGGGSWQAHGWAGGSASGGGGSWHATGAYGGVSRYDRRTTLSQDISPWPMPNFMTEINHRRYRAPWTPMLVFSPADKKSLYLGTQYVMRTVDGGLHIPRRIGPTLPESCKAPGA